MKNKLSTLIIFIFSMFIVFSCNKKYEGDKSIEDVKYKNNKTTISSTKMDSAQAINVITKQKIQDLLDLSILYTSGNRDTEIDSVIYAQMKGYFLSNDSLLLNPLFKDLDSLKVRYATVNNISIEKKFTGKDSIDYALFDVEYFDKKKSFIGNYKRDAHYILKAAPVKFQKEFKFFFVSFYDGIKKQDTIKTNNTNNLIK